MENLLKPDDKAIYVESNKERHTRGRARNVNTTIRCSHCGEAETTMPLLYRCDFAEKVWKLVPCAQTFESRSVQSVGTSLGETRGIICLPPPELERLFSPWIIWALWKNRNQKIFNNKQFTPEETENKPSTTQRNGN